MIEGVSMSKQSKFKETNNLIYLKSWKTYGFVEFADERIIWTKIRWRQIKIHVMFKIRIVSRLYYKIRKRKVLSVTWKKIENNGRYMILYGKQ